MPNPTYSSGKTFQPNLGALERAISIVNNHRLADIRAKAEILRTLWDPWTCPASELPALAWAWSVEIWEDWWPEHRKRRVIAESPLFHRRKTTVAGVRMALGYRDAELARYLLPRHKFFCGPDDTGNRAAWLASLSEIRIYGYGRQPVDAPARRYCEAGLTARGDTRRSRRAELHSSGTVTPLQILPEGTEERIVFPLEKHETLIAGRPGPRYAGNSADDLKTIAVKLAGTGSSESNGADWDHATAGDRGTAVATGRRVEGDLSLFADRPFERGGRFHCGRAVSAVSYLSIRYSDGAGRRVPRAPLNTVGRTRVGDRAYRATYTVGWSRPVPIDPFSRSRICAASPAELAGRLAEAVHVASALRDDLMLSFNATRRLTFADIRSIPAGTTFGERRKVSQ